MGRAPDAPLGVGLSALLRAASIPHAVWLRCNVKEPPDFLKKLGGSLLIIHHSPLTIIVVAVALALSRALVLAQVAAARWHGQLV